jgi:Bacterial membrane protein YfhO
MILALAAITVLETGYCAMVNFTPAGQPMSPPAYAQLSQHVTTFTSAGAELPRLGNGANPVDESSSEGYVAKKFHINEYNPLRLNRFASLIDKGFLPWMQTGPRVVALPPGSTPSNHAEFAPHATPVQYTPNYVRYKVSPTKDALLVFNEIYFPGWKARVDGQPEPIQPLLNGLRALPVKGGDHEIDFTFRPPAFFVALGISLACFALFLFLALRLRSLLKAGTIHANGEQSALFLGARSTET